jgi:hypothetical protein
VVPNARAVPTFLEPRQCEVPERVKGELQPPYVALFGHHPVSRTRKWSAGDWVFRDSCIGIGSHVPKFTGGAERRYRHSPTRRVRNVALADGQVANFAVRLSEKSRRHPKRGLYKAPNLSFVVPIDGPNTRPERRSHPFSDSLLTAFSELRVVGTLRTSP